MKYLFFLYITLFASFSLVAQITASVDVTFQNSRRKVIESRSFFKFRKMRSNFDTIRLDANRYLINYLDSIPSVIYLNGRPIIVSPGDSIKVTLKVLISNPEEMIDTIFATGNNSRNYTFSNFFSPKLIKGDIFPDLRDIKYQRDSRLLYIDLVRAYEFRDQYYRSYLKKEGYQNDIPNFIIRMNNIEFLSNALSLSTELGKNFKTQYKEFTEKLDDKFRKTDFIPTDTNYTSRMEEIFYAYFWHLSHIRFHPLELQKNTEDLIKFITNYPDPFVKDYFIFFLLTELKGVPKKYVGQMVNELTRSLHNKNILTELENKSTSIE